MSSAEQGAAGPGARRRLFFALWVDGTCRAQLGEAAARLLADLPGRALAPADWHVTLCFLGAVPERLLAPLREQAARIEAPAFSLHFERAEYWREARVLAALAASPPTAALQLAAALRAMARSLGLAPDEKPLRPHVTLARGVPAALWQRAAQRAAACTGQGALPAQGGLPLSVDLQAAEFHLAESLAESRARPAGETVASAPAPTPVPAAAPAPAPRSLPAPRVATAARYASLAHWPLRP